MLAAFDNLLTVLGGTSTSAEAATIPESSDSNSWSTFAEQINADVSHTQKNMHEEMSIYWEAVLELRNTLHHHDSNVPDTASAQYESEPEPGGVSVGENVPGKKHVREHYSAPTEKLYSAIQSLHSFNSMFDDVHAASMEHVLARCSSCISSCSAMLLVSTDLLDTLGQWEEVVDSKIAIEINDVAKQNTVIVGESLFSAYTRAVTFYKTCIGIKDFGFAVGTSATEIPRPEFWNLKPFEDAALQWHERARDFRGKVLGDADADSRLRGYEDLHETYNSIIISPRDMKALDDPDMGPNIIHYIALLDAKEVLQAFRRDLGTAVHRSLEGVGAFAATLSRARLSTWTPTRRLEGLSRAIAYATYDDEYWKTLCAARATIRMTKPELAHDDMIEVNARRNSMTASAALEHLKELDTATPLTLKSSRDLYDDDVAEELAFARLALEMKRNQVIPSLPMSVRAAAEQTVKATRIEVDVPWNATWANSPWIQATRKATAVLDRANNTAERQQASESLQDLIDNRIERDAFEFRKAVLETRQGSEAQTQARGFFAATLAFYGGREWTENADIMLEQVRTSLIGRKQSTHVGDAGDVDTSTQTQTPMPIQLAESARDASFFATFATTLHMLSFCRYNGADMLAEANTSSWATLLPDPPLTKYMFEMRTVSYVHFKRAVKALTTAVQETLRLQAIYTQDETRGDASAAASLHVLRDRLIRGFTTDLQSMDVPLTPADTSSHDTQKKLDTCTERLAACKTDLSDADLDMEHIIREANKKDAAFIDTAKETTTLIKNCKRIEEESVENRTKINHLVSKIETQDKADAAQITILYKLLLARLALSSILVTRAQELRKDLDESAQADASVFDVALHAYNELHSAVKPCAEEGYEMPVMETVTAEDSNSSMIHNKTDWCLSKVGELVVAAQNLDVATQVIRSLALNTKLQQILNQSSAVFPQIHLLF